MGRYGHKSLRCKNFYNFTMAGFGRLRSTDCGSHGRGPRFDPLCVHHSSPVKSGLFAFLELGHLGSCRQFQAELSSNRRGKSGGICSRRVLRSRSGLSRGSTTAQHLCGAAQNLRVFALDPLTLEIGIARLWSTRYRREEGYRREPVWKRLQLSHPV